VAYYATYSVTPVRLLWNFRAPSMRWFTVSTYSTQLMMGTVETEVYLLSLSCWQTRIAASQPKLELIASQSSTNHNKSATNYGEKTYCWKSVTMDHGVFCHINKMKLFGKLLCLFRRLQWQHSVSDKGEFAVISTPHKWRVNVLLLNHVIGLYLCLTQTQYPRHIS